MRHGDPAAVTSSDAHDRITAEMLAQRFDVLDVLIECVRVRITACRAPMAPLVKVDQLHPFGQPAIATFQTHMVDARPPVNEKRSRPLAHVRTVRSQTRSVNIEE